MKRLLYLLAFLPLLVNAQFTNQTIRKINSDGSIIASPSGDILQKKVIVNVKDYGAIGNGIANDGTAINNAITAAGNGGEVYFPNGTYLITSTITPVNAVSFIGQGNATIIGDVASSLINIASNTDATNIKLTSTIGAISQGYDYIKSVTTPTTVLPGDIVIINDLSRKWDTNNASSSYGETNVVLSVSADTLYLLNKTSSDYPSGTSVQVIRPLTNVKIQNLTLKRKTKTTNTAAGMALTYIKGAVIDNVIFDGFGNGGGLETAGVGNTYTNIKAYDGFYAGVGLGYGIAVYSSISTRISDSYFQNMRRGVDISGYWPSRFCTVSNSIADATTYNTSGETAGFSSHSSSEYTIFSNIKVINTTTGIFTRGNYTHINGLTVIGVPNIITSAFGKGRYIDGVYSGGLSTSPNYFAEYFYSEYSEQNNGGGTGTGVGLDGVIIKNVVANINTSFIYINGEVRNDLTISVDNSEIYTRTGVSYFVQAANQVGASPFNIYANNTKFQNSSSVPIPLVNSAGTNAVLNVRGISGIASSGTAISGTATSGVGVLGVATTGIGAKIVNNSATNAPLYVTQSGSSAIAAFDSGAGSVTLTNGGGVTASGTVTTPSLTLGSTAVTSTATRLNYLTSATGTTGTTSSNLVFSASPTLSSPTLTTPNIGVATGTSLNASGVITGTTGVTGGYGRFGGLTYFGAPFTAQNGDGLTDTRSLFATNSPLAVGARNGTAGLVYFGAASNTSTPDVQISNVFGTALGYFFHSGGFKVPAHAGVGTRMSTVSPDGTYGTSAIPGGGGGSVTGVSGATANGFALTSDGAAVVPTMTVTTTVNSPVLAANGSAVLAATTTGTGSTVVLATSPTLVTPALGTPTALVGTNITGTAAGLTAGAIVSQANSATIAASPSSGASTIVQRNGSGNIAIEDVLNFNFGSRSITSVGGGLTVNSPLTATSYTGAATGLTGTAASLTAGNANTLAAYSLTFTTGANTVVGRDANNYVFVSYLNSDTPNDEAGVLSQFVTTNGSDGFYRKRSVAQVQTALGLASSAYYNATFNNTGNNIVLRDGSGNFSAGTITATLFGNASSATSVAWTGVAGRPTALSSFTNDLGNYGGWITGINSSNVTTALGFTPYNATNPSGFISSINYGNVTMALGYTPVNPSSLASVGTSGAYLDLTGKPSIPSIIMGSYSGSGSSTTTFTVTGFDISGTGYKVEITPLNSLSSGSFYLTNKTTTSFDVVFTTGLTGTVAFDWIMVVHTGF